MPSCLDGARILEILGDAYDAKSQSASRRALQRDLEALVKEGRIEAVNPGGKPLRYRRLKDDLEYDTLILEYTLRQVRDLIAEAIPRRQLDQLSPELLHPRLVTMG